MLYRATGYAQNNGDLTFRLHKRQEFRDHISDQQLLKVCSDECRIWNLWDETLYLYQHALLILFHSAFVVQFPLMPRRF